MNTTVLNINFLKQLIYFNSVLNSDAQSSLLGRFIGIKNLEMQYLKKGNIFGLQFGLLF